MAPSPLAAWRRPLVIVVAACALASSACATLYKAPISGKTARIHIATDGVVHLFPIVPCPDHSAPRAGLGPVHQEYSLLPGENTGRVLGMPQAAELKVPGLAATELLLQAGEPVLVTYRHVQDAAGRRYVCEQSLRFTPEEGEEYAAIARMKDQRFYMLCSMGVVAYGYRDTVYVQPKRVKDQYIPEDCKKRNEPRSEAEPAPQ